LWVLLAHDQSCCRDLIPTIVVRSTPRRPAARCCDWGSRPSSRSRTPSSRPLTPTGARCSAGSRWPIRCRASRSGGDANDIGPARRSHVTKLCTGPPIRISLASRCEAQTGVVERGAFHERKT
jgi:hypothetical protein